ncbi:MAG: membrane dipeptidase [Sandaracinaceae bacterium]|nr:membrane dipeptidase [Sandaracinaceae bacterium]
MKQSIGSALLVLVPTLWLGCESPVERPPPPENDGVYSFADGCYAMDATEPGSTDTRWLEPTETGDGFAFTAREASAGSRFFMKASDLGTYLFYDQDGRYLVADDGPLLRQGDLLSDILTVDDTYISGAEWELQVSVTDATRFQLHHRRTGQYLTRTGLTADASAAAVIALYPQEGCTAHPELTVDAEGTVEPRTFEDGSLFGIVETHSHVMSNFGFGGGGVFHGAPYHRLGVEHALPDCDLFHGPEGRFDLFGYGYDQGSDIDVNVLLPAFISGRLSEFNHHTEGYPEFTDWPAAPHSSTHQTQYYLWIERAWRAGLRLMVQHATTNEIICELLAGEDIQRVRYSCNDMVAVDRIIEETYNLERYIDAQWGGPGRGFFRVVTTPAEAREVIAQGKLAIILGIETSNLFDCFSVQRDGFPVCDEAFMISQLDRYYELGVRVMFPVHKYDNAFSAGDGNRSFIELGNFINSGQWSSFTQDCPTDVPSVFDHGSVNFGGLNMPRDEYMSPAPNDMSGFAMDPIQTVAPFLNLVLEPALEGDWCQSHGLTPLGERLLHEMMARGMIIEVDHLPRRSYQRAFEILEAADYPAAGTHGTNFDGRIYALGGVSKTGLGRCADPANPHAMTDRLNDRVALIESMGGYPAEGFGFDLNGFAGAPGPRFGERSGCSTEQTNPITYPFTSYAGDVTFTEPHVGNRTIDFNTEGMAHLGLLPELIEDARRGGSTDEDLEPLFRSAEGYLRMWERAEERSASMP